MVSQPEITDPHYGIKFVRGQRAHRRALERARVGQGSRFRGERNQLYVTISKVARDRLIEAHLRDYLLIVNEERAKVGLGPIVPQHYATDTARVTEIKAEFREIGLRERRRRAALSKVEAERSTRCRHPAVEKRTYGKFCRECGQEIT